MSVQKALSKGKVLPLSKVAEAARRARRENKKIVTTNGCFDLIHAGHLLYLERASALGDLLIVGVNSDASIRSLKGAGRPILSIGQRMKLLAGFAAVDYVFTFKEKDPVAFIQKLKPHIHVKGGNYSGRILEQDAVEANGGKVKILDFLPHSSTTGIVKKIKGLP